MAGMTDEEFYNFLSTPQTVPELPDWMRTDNPVGAAIAAADAPQVENNTPVPDEVLAPQQPAWTPEPAPAPLSLTDPASFQGLTPPSAQQPPQNFSVEYSRSGPRTPIQPPKPVTATFEAPPGPQQLADYLMPGVQQFHRANELAAEGEQGLIDLESDQARQAADINLDARAQAHAQAKQNAEDEAQARAAAEAKWAAIKDVNPQRVWADSSNLTKASGIVAAAIGGWLSVSTRSGKNGPLDTIMQMIDQDIRAQMANQEQARAGAYRADRMVDKTIEAGQRKIESIHVERAARLEQVKQSILAEAGKFKSQINQANHIGEASKLDMQIAKELQQASQSEFEAIQKQREFAVNKKLQQQQIGLGYARLNLEKEQFKYQQGKDALARQGGIDPKALAGKAIKDPATGNVIGYQLTGSDSNAFETQKKLNATTSFVNRFAKFQELQKKHGSKMTNWGTFLQSPEGQELQGLWNDLLEDYIVSKTGAAAPTEQMNRLKNRFPIQRYLGPNTERNNASFLEDVVSGANFDIGGLVSNPDGSPAAFNYQQTADRLRARYGYGNEEAALPDQSIHNAGLKVMSTLGKPSFVGGMNEFISKAHNVNDTPGGRQAIIEIQKELAKVPREQRMLPTGDRNGSVGEIDAIEALDIVLQLGELDSGAREQRDRFRQMNTDAYDGGELLFEGIPR